MDERSIFSKAREISEPGAREAWITEVTGGNSDLRQRIIDMLEQDAQRNLPDDAASVDLEATVMTDGTSDLPSDIDSDSIAIGDLEPSILRSLSNTIGEIPTVSLKESEIDFDEPLQRPSSSEIPKSSGPSRYQLQGEIARGGMGAIIRGRDTDLGRDLAIKILLDSQKDKPEVIQRFIEEAQIAGQLQHPGITPVYELGQFADQRPFFSMKLVKGQTLSKLLFDRADTTAERGKFIGIFEQICQTVAYAHSRGVIHRDLKPANIMVGAFGEVQVMDWGLAKVLPAGGVADERKKPDAAKTDSIIRTMRDGVGSVPPAVVGSVGSETQSGSVMGTPAYMPPEQAMGDVDAMDERADVFGLGAILCEILTGLPPYVGKSGTQTYRLAARAELDDCRQRLDECTSDQDLIALAKHCLQPDPADRPRDARALAERITSYLESVESKLREAEVKRAASAARADAEAAQASAERRRAEAESARANEENRRRRTSLAFAASIFFLVGIGGAGWLYMLQQEAAAQRQHASEMQLLAQQRDDQRKAAEELTVVADMARTTAQTAEQKGLQLLYATDMQLVSALMKADSPRSQQIVSHLKAHDPASALNVTHGQDQRGFEWHYFERLIDSQAQVFEGFPRKVVDLTVTPEGQLVTLDQSAWVQRFDLGTSQPVQESLDLASGRNVGAMALSQDGRRVALAIDDTVHLLDALTGEQATPPISATTWRHGLLFSPDGKMVITVDSGVSWWNAESGELIATRDLGLKFPPKWFNSPPAVSSDGMTVVVSGQSYGGTAADSFNVLQLDLAKGEIWRKLKKKGGNGTRQFVTLSPNGEYVATSGAFDRNLQILQSPSGNRVQSYPGAHASAINRICFNPEGTQIATASAEGAIKVWNDFQELDAYKKLAQQGASIPELTNLVGHTEQVDVLRFVDGGKHLVSFGRDMTVRIWNLNDWKSSLQQTIAGAIGHRAAFSPDGTLFAVSGDREGVLIRDAATGQILAKLTDRQDGRSARSVAFSPNNDLLAIGFDGKENVTEVEVWDIDDRRRLAVLSTALAGFQGAACRTSGLSFSPDGQALVASLGKIDTFGGNTDRSLPLLVYDTASWKLRNQLQGHHNTCLAVSFSPDGTRMASCSFDGTTLVWDCETWSQLQVLDNPMRNTFGDGHRVNDVAYSPDGALIATANDRGTVIVWDAKSGKHTQVLRGGANAIRAVAFTPNGRTLAFASTNGTVRLFNTATWRELTILEGNEPVSSLSFSPDGGRLLAASYRDATIWATDSQKANLRLKPQQLLTLLHSKADFKKRMALLSGNLQLHESLAQLPPEDLKSQPVQTAFAAARTQWLAENQRFDEAMKQYDALRLLDERPKGWFRASGLLCIADMLLRKDRLSEAAEFASRALQSLRENGTKMPTVQDQLAAFRERVDLELKGASRDQHLLEMKAELLGAGGKTEPQINAYTKVIELLKDEPSSLVSEDLMRLHQRRGDAFLSAQNWQRAYDDYEIGISPSTTDSVLLANQAMARAGVLLDRSPRWTTLAFIDYQSKNGSKLTVQADKSILVTGKRASGDHYELVMETDLEKINAIRVEALTDRTLPNAGPGRSSDGVFVMNWSVEAAERSTPEAMNSVELSAADADYAWSKSPLTPQHWHIEGGKGKPHQAWFQCATSLESVSGFRFKFNIGGSTARGWKDQIMGRFRLSVSSDDDAISKAKGTFFARKLTEPWTKLAAAYYVNGDRSHLRNLLERHPNVTRKLADFTIRMERWEDAISFYGKLIDNDSNEAALFTQRATAHIAAEQWQQAEADWQRAIELQPGYAERAFDLFRKTKRWNAAAAFGQQFLTLKPNQDALQWLRVSPFVANGTDEETYTDFCSRIAEQFKDSQSLHDIDCVVKASLLRPRQMIETSSLAEYFEQQLDSGNARDSLAWYWSTRALLAYRRGESNRVIQYVTKSNGYKPGEKILALTRSLLAAAHFQNQQFDEAQTLLDEARKTVNRLTSNARNRGEHNTVIAQVLLSEVEEMVQPKGSGAIDVDKQ